MNVLFARLRPLTESMELATGKNIVYFMYDYMGAFFLMLYGLPTFITGTSMKFKPMIWGGIICWVSCLAAVFTPVKIDLILTAFSALFAWFIPGIILERDYRKAKKELGAQHV